MSKDIPTEFPTGMTLRDYFAAQAIAGKHAPYDSVADIIAVGAYRLADALLAERKKDRSKKAEKKEILRNMGEG